MNTEDADVLFVPTTLWQLWVIERMEVYPVNESEMEMVQYHARYTEFFLFYINHPFLGGRFHYAQPLLGPSDTE